MQKKKSITIIGINYYPENTSTGLYTTQLAEYLAEKNLDVNVISGFPYYPAWKIDKEYQNKKWFLKENNNNVTIYRYKQYVPKTPTFFKRILHLIDFTIGSIINVFRIKRTDVVLCIVPFTSSIFLGKMLSVFKGAKLWVHVQDFEFDAALETNLVSSKRTVIFRLLHKIESSLFKSADITSTISKSMLQKLETKVKNKKEKKLLPNWVDLNDISPNDNVHNYMKSDKFKILYSGNIGEKQDWVFFIEFVEKLKGYPNIEIIIVGDGSGKNILLKEIQKRKMTNIKHFFPVPYNELSDLLCNADLHILFQKEDVKDTVMPSKILAMMASEKPSLITGNKDSEVAKIINESKAGRYYESKELNEMIKFINSLYNNEALINDYGENARNYVSQNFSRGNILKMFHNTFINLTK